MRAPDRAGPLGARAWLLSVRPPQSPAQSATLRGYLVEQPGVHLAWSRWMVALIHLRDIPGAPPANKRSPDVEYEILAAAIHPEAAVDPDMPFPRGALLQPLDQVHQFGGGTDAQARQLLDQMVDHVLAGHASFDSDFRSYWESAIPRMLEDMRLGDTLTTALAERTYVGERSEDGPYVAVREAGDTRELDPRLDLWNHSPTGFEWGYAGSGPAQLALAILADALGNDDLARERHHEFKREYVARWRQEGFSITAADVRRWAGR